jgi:signal transduction histidine kinase
MGRHFSEVSPIFEGLEDSILSIQPGEPTFLLPFISFSMEGQEYELNMEFFRRPGHPEIVWLMSSQHEFKYKLQQMQQQRNDSIILLETIETQKKQLSEANEQLETMNNGLDRFAYIVSHDLKSPLRAIGTLSEWIGEAVETGDMDEIREHLALLQKRTRRMENLIEGILHYSRAGRTQVEKLPVKTMELVQEVMESNFRESAAVLHTPQPLPELFTIRTSLYQVFSNLISNAIKYSDKAVPEITITFTEKDDWTEFRVTDNGPGIAPRHHAYIFEIFSTLQSRDSYESTGIGLTIVQKIVEDGGGKIWVESDLGEGATFVFTWPK